MADLPVSKRGRLRVLLELRPALDGHAGIPQQTRLLFRQLAVDPGIAVCGLLQSSTHALGRGIADSGSGEATDRHIDRLSRVVIMIEERFARSNFSVVFAVLRRLAGVSERLTRFDPVHFKDFIWHRLFARSLPPEDFELVTRAGYRIARTPWTAMHIVGLVSRFLGRTVLPRLDASGFDVMLAETPYPARVSRRTALVIRYHDAIPLLLPHTISTRRHHQRFHYQALRDNVRSGAWFVCVSEATRRDLIAVFPQAEARSVTIHNIVSHEYFDAESPAEQVPAILRARCNLRLPGPLQRRVSRSLAPDAGVEGGVEYLLMVSTVEPRKNHLTLLTAWEMLRTAGARDMKLVVVGSLGWHHKAILARMRHWIEAGDVVLLENVPARELRVLYQHARATVCPSRAEGFDLSGIEAMRSGGVVVASDIPVHQEIYCDAAEYFNPHSADDLLRALKKIIDAGAGERRAELRRRGTEVARRYESSVIMPKWADFLGRVTEHGVPQLAGP